MFELANTSLPNGLIPGTHGFATVAMTKGLPDALRQRLEALCAYTHRQSAHDERYFRENPVNWFHVALPTGEHAVGRVAACDFDYTGRTNRLARMLVFPPREMPHVGAARVLYAEKARLSAPWDGEPRWLASDAATATRLATSATPVGANPSAWTAKFGAGGATIAQRFALLLEKCVRDGGKPIYFKTSAASDPDGTGLLSLFADLIDLLPPELRSAVTFSTYPDALPNGTRCHLRGAFDGDRAFAAASTLQPWVDCDHGRVMHEELLPAPKAPPQPAAPRLATSARPLQPGAAPRAGAAPTRPQSYFPKPTQAKWLPPERKNSERNFYIILGSVAAAVVVAFAAGLWLMQKRQKVVVEQPPEVAVAGVAAATTNAPPNSTGVKSGEHVAESVGGNVDQDTTTNETSQVGSQTNKVAGNDLSSQSSHADGDAESEDRGSQSADATGGNNDSSQFEFEKATLFEVIKRDRLSDTKFIEAHPTMTTFYYDDGKCEELKKCETVKGTTKLGDTYYSPKLDGDGGYRQNVTGRFVIFYDSENSAVFWLWLLPTDAEKGKEWFLSSESHNLQHEAFGDETCVFDFYKKNAGDPSYTITRSDGEVFVGGIILESEKETSEALASLNLFEPDSAKRSSQKAALESRVTEAEQKLTGVKDSVNKYNTDASTFETDVGKLKAAIVAREGLMKKIEDEGRKGKKKDQKKIDSDKKEKNAKEQEISNLAKKISDDSSKFGGLSVSQSDLARCRTGDDVVSRLRENHIFSAEGKIKRLNATEESKAAQAHLDEAKQKFEEFEKSWQDKWRERVKKSNFAITKIRGSKEKKGGVQ